MIIVLFQFVYYLGKYVLEKCGHKADLYPKKYNVRDLFESHEGYYYSPSNSGDENSDGDDDDDTNSVQVNIDWYRLMMRDDLPIKRRYSNDSDMEEENKTSIIKFSPPAYVQRYQAVQDVLVKDKMYAGKLKKVVDFGCAELSLFVYLKNLISIHSITFVDVDRTTLEFSKNKIRPLHVDYLHRRSTPLGVSIYEGSVTESDVVLQNTDAVICIELIEHLYPETLNDLPYNIFGYIKPKIAIFTTPNAEFNVLFTNMQRFRHPDHKFEWTRQEFEDWANNIILRYPNYEVSFRGICYGPEGTEHLGACTQMAIFRQNNMAVLANNDPAIGHDGLYKLVAHQEYPFEVDNRTDEQKILDDAIYYIRKFSTDEDMSEEVPLDLIARMMSQYCVTPDILKEILESDGWTIANTPNGLVAIIPPASDTFSDHEYDNFWNDDVPPNYETIESEETSEMTNLANEDWDSSNSNSYPAIYKVQNDYTLSGDLNNTTTDSMFQSCSTALNNGDLVYKGSKDNSDETGCLAETICSAVEESITLQNSIAQKRENIDDKLLKESANESVQDIRDSDYLTLTEPPSMCSMFIEPSSISKNICLQELSDPLLEFSSTSSLDKTNENSELFLQPKYTSSPQESGAKKKKPK